MLVDRTAFGHLKRRTPKPSRFRTRECLVGILLFLAHGWIAGPSEAVQDEREPKPSLATQSDGGRALASPDTLWRIDPEPVLVLGQVEGPEEHLFLNIRGATRLSTGTIVVLDGASRQLRAFSTTGDHVWTAGGRGDGPGEMRSPSHLERLPGDSLQVQDFVSRIRYAPDGDVIAHSRLPVQSLRNFGPYFVGECPVPSFVGDHVLACTSGSDVSQIPSASGPWRQEIRLALLPWDLDAFTELGVFLKEEAWALPLIGMSADAVRLLGARRAGNLTYASLPMARKTMFAVGGSPRKLAVADTGGDVLRLFDLTEASAPPPMSLTIRRVRRPPTSDELGRAWEAVARYRWRGQLEYLKEHLPAPDSIPNVDDLVVDDAGMVWVGEYLADSSTARRYHVYGPEGRFVAQVMMPAGVEVLEIGADYLLGRTHDALEVERVVVLNLVRTDNR